MNELKALLIDMAVKEFHHILPCNTAKSIEDSFTIEGKQVLFWFNTEDNTTHLLSKEIVELM